MSFGGVVYTFYSFKGGVGRSMALANIACLLSRWGKRVLVVDWDLEAPGLDRYFFPYIADGSRATHPGVLDILLSYKEGSPVSWEECLLVVELPTNKGMLHLITAGRDTSEYAKTVQSLDWDFLFEKYGVGEFLNDLRNRWKARYDFILVDSRTGYSDIGGICTIVFPDVLVLIFTTNWQSINGIKDVMKRARTAQDRLPAERARLVAIPVLARDESRTEYEQSLKWRGIIVDELGEFYRDWIGRGVRTADVLGKIYIPYWAYWSFGERLPVVEKEEELADSSRLGAAYGRLAQLIANHLDWRSIDRIADPAELETYRTQAYALEAEGARVQETAAKARLTAHRLRLLTVLMAFVLVISVTRAYSFGIERHKNGSCRQWFGWFMT
jgi:cellulose biosynthesis protein BcsQ